MALTGRVGKVEVDPQGVAAPGAWGEQAESAAVRARAEGEGVEPGWGAAPNVRSSEG